MITGLSKAVALYLAPLLALTSTILSVLIFLAPSITLHTQVSLISVAPTGAGDGPSVWLGAIGQLYTLPGSDICADADHYRLLLEPFAQRSCQLHVPQRHAYL
jgi:hypothetical protein